MTIFKKGQVVNLVGVWNRYGSSYIRNCVVHSCGKKRLILIDAKTGEHLDEWFTPVRSTSRDELFVLTEEEDAGAIAKDLAERLRQNYVESETKSIETHTGSEQYWANRKAVLETVIKSEITVKII